MGQYYNVVMQDEGDEPIALDHRLDGKYTPAKLTEHSWWLNPFVNTICNWMWQMPGRIAWVGDYAKDEDKHPNDLTEEKVFELYGYAYDDEVKCVRPESIHEQQLVLHNKFIINHTKHEYLDCEEYYDRCYKIIEQEWIPHPLPLLTAIGNGQGGGDYRGKNQELVGSWAWDVIEIDNKRPEDTTDNPWRKRDDIVFAEV